MTVAAGTRLGPYEVTAQIGAGGMGDVYRATDTKLGRQVAIKTLPSALMQDPDRRARFEREAKLLAALNHPHIAAIYGLDEHEGTRFLAMELIEGTTLEVALRDDPLPLDDALGLALQIAQALEAAHEKGVMHRDLKPANVMVTRDGQVKVLDFGLAKAFSGDPNQTSLAHSPALSLAMTEQGVILGTAAYMSPEQASGQATDQRADIWAFGVVLFEMLSGRPLFSGESVPQILADVLRSEPDWNRLPKNLHPRLKMLLERCLEKKVRNRYHSMADVRVDIEKVLSDPQGATRLVAVAQPARQRAWPVVAALVAGALLASVVVATLMRPAPQPPPEVTRFLVTPPATAPLTSLSGLDFTISPDGTQIAYLARDFQSDRVALFLRDVDELDARLVPGTETALMGNQAMNVFFSADSQSVGFSSPGRGIMRVAVSGGTPLKMLDEQPSLAGADWAAADTLIFSSGNGLYLASAGGGGTPDLLTDAESLGRLHVAPVLLPGGRAVLFGLLEGAAERVAVLDLETRQEKTLIEAAANAAYAATGHIVFVRDTTLMAVPFDLDRLAVTGEPVALLEGVRHPVRNPGAYAAADYALSDTGTLVYAPGGASRSSVGMPVWVDRTGRVTGDALSERVDLPRDPRLSPDGRRLALVTGAATDGDLWIYDLGGRPPIPLADEGNSVKPVWSPDGSQLAFVSDRGGSFQVYGVPADGSVIDPPPLHPGLEASPEVWSAEGELLLWRPRGSDILATRPVREPDLRDVVVTADAESDPALSPDGRWLAYASDRTGQAEIWVKGYPEGSPVRVSRAGGYEPRWSADGQELFYLQGNAIMAVAVQTDGEFSFDAPVQLFSGPYAVVADPGAHSYDVARDGRFLMIQLSDVASSTSIVVVQNWFEELKRLAPPK